MSDTPKYQLRPGVKIAVNARDDYILQPSQFAACNISKAIFEESFVPVDVQAIKEQIKEILHDFSLIPRGKTYTPSEWTNKILAVVGLETQTKETE